MWGGVSDAGVMVPTRRHLESVFETSRGPASSASFKPGSFAVLQQITSCPDQTRLRNSISCMAAQCE